MEHSDNQAEPKKVEYSYNQVHLKANEANECILNELKTVAVYERKTEDDQAEPEKIELEVAPFNQGQYTVSLFSNTTVTDFIEKGIISKEAVIAERIWLESVFVKDVEQFVNIKLSYLEFVLNEETNEANFSLDCSIAGTSAKIKLSYNFEKDLLTVDSSLPFTLAVYSKEAKEVEDV